MVWVSVWVGHSAGGLETTVAVDHTSSFSLSDVVWMLSVEPSWVVRFGMSVSGGTSLVEVKVTVVEVGAESADHPVWEESITCNVTFMVEGRTGTSTKECSCISRGSSSSSIGPGLAG